ncbi:MAG: RluA family pseudouridine synthase [Luteibaculaceae bacterium]
MSKIYPNQPDLDNEKEQDEDELFEHFSIVVDKGQSLLRVDKFLNDKLPNTSRNKIQQAAENGFIKVNETVVKSNYRVKPLDKVVVALPYPVREIELIPENLPINVAYEDDSFVIINKEPGMVVHPGYGNYTGTLVNALVYHFSNLPLDKNADFPRPGLVHRIDKNTSGLMVIAKTDESHAKLAKLFFDRNIDRQYVALVWGDVKEDSGTITGNIGRSLKNRKVMEVFPEGEFGKHAVTHYTVLERFGYVTLVACKLETGRTHQIRVHFKHIGHPLFNDIEYGGDKLLKGTSFAKYKQFIDNCFSICPRHALHAKTLGFVHPKKQEKVFFDSEIPADMQNLIDKWRNYVTYNT